MPVEDPAPLARPSGEILRGVTLDQYAGISAGLADEIPLEALLANEGIDPAAWPAADVAWKERLAADGQGGAVFAAFRDRRAEAEDWLGRRVAPLDDDLGAWVSFLHALSVAPAPFELFARAGLRMSDLARLTRRWARRMEDPAIQEEAAALAKEGAGPLPAIHASAAVLRPFPWSRGKAKSPLPPREPAARISPSPEISRARAVSVDDPAKSASPAPARKHNALSDLSLGLKIPENLPPPRHAAAVPPPDPPAGAFVPPLTVEQYASLCVELTASPERAAETLSRYRITPAQKDLIDNHYRDRFAKDPGLRAAWDQAYLTYREWYLATLQRRG